MFIVRFYTLTIAPTGGTNIGIPVPREPFSFGGLGDSKFGHLDITGDGGMEFFSHRVKITSKWPMDDPPQQESAPHAVDRANFAGSM